MFWFIIVETLISHVELQNIWQETFVYSTKLTKLRDRVLNLMGGGDNSVKLIQETKYK
jgi:hypothetical protein